MIQVSSLPYRLVVLASLLPWVAAYLDSKFVTLLPDFVMIGVFLMLTFLGRLRLSTSFVSIAMLLALGVHSAIGILDGRGIGSGGLVLLALEIFIFYKLLGSASGNVTPRVSARWVTSLYKLHLLFLGFELALCLAGYQNIFVGIAGATTVTTIYKTYNTGLLLNYFGYSGLNSLVLGSQSASQLVLFALAWFVGARMLAPAGLMDCRNLAWVVFAAAMYPFNATMTSNLLLIMLYTMVLFLFRSSRSFGWKALLLLLPFGVYFAEELLQTIFFRILEENDWLIYYSALEVPLEVYRSIGLYRQLLGWGSDIDEFVIPDTNFGLGALVFQVGLVLSVVCFVCVAAFCKSLVAVRSALGGGGAQSRMEAYIATINGLLALAWLASLVHYTPAVELGGRQIFAFHVAIALTFMSKLNALRKGAIENYTSKPVGVGYLDAVSTSIVSK